MTDDALIITVNLGGFDDVSETLLEAGVRAALRAEGRRDGEVSVTLLDDDGIQELNRTYLGRDRPTDVIAFSLGEEDALLGDVYVGVPQARRQAGEYEVPVGEELLRLVIHGTLHVLGHDHPEGPERTESPMYDAQERYVREVLS